MRLKHLSLLFIFFCNNLYAQETRLPDSAIVPFLVQKRDARGKIVFEKEDFNPRISAYAVKGKIPADAKILRRLADNLHIVSVLDQRDWDSLQKKALFVLPVNPYWKLSPALLPVVPGRKPLAKRVQLLLSVNSISLFKKQYANNRSIMYRYADSLSNAIQAEANPAWIITALNDPNIYFISTSVKPITERELTGFDLSVNKVNKAHRVWPGLNAAGLTLSVKENRMDTADIDFKGRYLFSPSASSLMQTHATTMATIAAGGGNSFYTGKGVAWGANISSSDFSVLLPDKEQELQQLNVSVQNHSYGTAIENYYGADAAAYDQQLAANPTLLHVFSAGNSGTQTSNAGNYAGVAGFANITGSFKMAKNIITVGATDSFGLVAPLSSRGPAYDGRIKPELTAWGEDGSSGAAAIVSGIALLVQHAYQVKNGSLPVSAITKAIMINSADDVGRAGIDFTSGYGAANGWRSLQTVEQGRVITGSVQQQQNNTHSIVVPPNCSTLKLTLSWIDPAAQPNSFKALVNDIDLELQHTASTQSWLPWVLNSAASVDSLKQPPTRRRDSLNNTEQVSVTSPPAGTYRVIIRGFNLSTNTQSYALAWHYDTLNAFQFEYPVKGTTVFAGQPSVIRWQSTIADTATLQYSVNGAGNWQTAVTGIDLPAGYVKWVAPDTFASLQLRMVVAGRRFLSDTVSISKNLSIRTGFNCADSFLIYWQTATAITKYRLFRLGTKYLEPFLAVNDSALTQYKSNTPYSWFTVAPVLPFDIDGLKAYTFNYSHQQSGCYINSFIADPTGINQAKLSLQLGTTYRVEKIIFEKLTVNGFAPIQDLVPTTAQQYTLTVAAGKGLNVYRAKLLLQGGAVYYTSPGKVAVFDNQPYYVFPNPVRQGAGIHLLAEDTDNTIFLLFDATGKKRMEYKITGFINEITLPLLQKGTYYYTLMKAGIKQTSHKLIVL